MKLRCVMLLILMALGLLSLSTAVCSAQATDDLMTVYAQALHSDPVFQRAESDWEAAQENLPIARAAYLTSVAIRGNVERRHGTTRSEESTSVSNYHYGFSLDVSQPVFNWPALMAIRNARAVVQSAMANYTLAGQELMLRTARAYVDVLQAQAQLRYTLARKRAGYQQLLIAQQQFKVGLIAITGVYDARSFYDQAVASAIGDRNSLNDAVERLREITGMSYLKVCGIAGVLPLTTPHPNDIDAWVQVSEQQNYSLRAESFLVMAAHETIKQQATGWLPQVALDANYTNDNETATGSRSALTSHSFSYGASLVFPLLQGGFIPASTRQARSEYLSAINQREFVRRSVLSRTRQSFLGVITGISKIKADRQSVISAQNALDATKAGHAVGTRTMVDILNDVSALYRVQQEYTADQYQYLLDIIELKFDAGTLSVDDLEHINQFFSKDVTLQLSDQPKPSNSDLEDPIQPVDHSPAPTLAAPAQLPSLPVELPATPVKPLRPAEPVVALAPPRSTGTEMKTLAANMSVGSAVTQLPAPRMTQGDTKIQSWG